MRVVSYIGSLPAKTDHNSNKVQYLTNFAAGVTAAGDHGLVHRGPNIIDADVAVILGWVHEHGKKAPHLALRQRVIDHQRATGGHTVVIDSNLFRYKDLSDPDCYLRYSFDGVFPNTGIYCDTEIDPSRWQIISQSLNMPLQPYRKNGHHILMCLQRDGGWSMGNFSVVDWIVRTVQDIRQYTDREIVLRPHPGDKGAAQYLADFKPTGPLKRVRISTNRHLMDDLRKCWCVVNHNSSPTVGAAIEGYPIFVTDPFRTQCREIANTEFSTIENPQLPDRRSWINRLSMFHWSQDEVLQGDTWRHMRKFI